jgi:Zn-dependent protease
MDFWPLVVLPFSVCVHELAHALVADACGDPTPRSQGRLSVNPLRHMDVFGTVVLPLGLFLISGGNFLLAYAKPVELEPDQFEHPRKHLALVALAGPLANGVTGAMAAVLWSVLPGAGLLRNGLLWMAIMSLCMFVLNLIPVPPLDGSKLLLLLPERATHGYLEHGVWVSVALVGLCIAFTAFTPLDPLTGLLEVTVSPMLDFFTGLWRI